VKWTGTYEAAVGVVFSEFIKLVGQLLYILLMHIFSFLYQCELTLQVFYGVLLVNRFKLKFSRLLFFFAKVLSEYFNDILELLNNRNFFLHLFDFVVPFLQFNFGVVVLFHALL